MIEIAIRKIKLENGTRPHATNVLGLGRPPSPHRAQPAGPDGGKEVVAEARGLEGPARITGAGPSSSDHVQAHDAIDAM